ncbi:uncharacterized protein F4807DRAFT_452377 [Annulohypoxylon truncatum]|uniref:uncharacterized protein n=1 Tax=Annulohypoxylon truncatum TaxID=327061 RepID=UPI0020088924|nr:uncharacterized protein F4807DRAFT_452377 [Annulohypoxylon truncatum]KAI1208476.1 hypothetical protein F4807DRAFT_452377 [Annulohypoxylon truncatum]
MSSGTRKDNILPLESFALTAVPASTHNVVWSPDAELAVGCDDCVYIFIPDFTIPKSQNGRDPGIVRQYNDVALRFPSVEHRSPELNRPLFDYVGQEFPEFEFVPGGGGSGPVTSQGSSMNHLISLEWSPCGLGRMNRSVLAVLTGAGTITVYCEGASDRKNAFKPRGRNARTLLPWVAAWGVGAGLLLPVVEGHEVEYVKEYVTAFAWARDTDGYGALLAYANDEDDIVIVSVQAKHDPNADAGDCGQWRVEEVARFTGMGPHPKAHQNDPDSFPSGSSFSLSWGPWLKKGASKSSMISYVARGYVGFRQVTIDSPQHKMASPKVRVDQVDTDGVCLYLAQDAFVVWEDLIWTIGQSKVCRGIIATPMLAKAFQVSFDDSQSGKIVRHTAYECGSAYPDIEDDTPPHNPITGLVIHPPSLSQTTRTPSYSLVRLSATHENDAWYQTNLPLPPNPEDETAGPRWATEINQIVEHQLPRAMAYRAVVDGGSVGSEDVSDEDEEMETESFEGSNYDPDEGFAGIDTEDQVHINRVRIWGMASSPGGGVTAVFISQHNTVFYGRDTFAGIKCRVLFGRHDSSAEKSEEALTTLAMKKLSTEAKTWEWMYGGGPPVPGVGSSTIQSSESRSALKDHFELVVRQQVCSFCKSPLRSDGKMCWCGKGHPFATCATTGLPILAPGLSRTCNVCGSKCLNRENLIVMAPQLKDIIMDEISDEFCGNCGGKFVN